MASNLNMDPQTLGLYSEPLQEFRENLDEMLRILVVNLTERSMEAGILTAKIKVTIDRPADGGYTQMKIEPDIGLKIGAKGSKKCQKQEGIFLQYDAEGVPVIAGTQIGVDEYIRRMNNREESA